MVNAESHQFRWITFDRCEVNAMASYPVTKLGMRGYLWSVAFGKQALAQSDVRLNVTTRANSQASDSKRSFRLEVQNRSRRIVKEDGW